MKKKICIWKIWNWFIKKWFSIQKLLYFLLKLLQWIIWIHDEHIKKIFLGIQTSNHQIVTMPSYWIIKWSFKKKKIKLKLNLKKKNWLEGMKKWNNGKLFLFSYVAFILVLFCKCVAVYFKNISEYVKNLKKNNHKKYKKKKREMKIDDS